MKLIFAVLDVSLTMGLTRCYKTEGFFYIYLQLKALVPLSHAGIQQPMCGHPRSKKISFRSSLSGGDLLEAFPSWQQ